MFRYIFLNLTVALLCISIRAQGNKLSSIFGLDRDKDLNDVSFIKGDHLRKQYNEMNGELLTKTNSEDPNQNMNLVMESYTKHVPKKSVSRSKTLQAEKLFLSMRKLESDKMTCSAHGKRVLEENKSALKQEQSFNDFYDEYEFYMGPGEPERRRIDDIYQYYLENHAKLCSQEYRNSFNKKLENMEENELKQVSDLVDERIANYKPDKIMPEIKRLLNFVRYHRSHSEYVLEGLLKVLDHKPDFLYLNFQTNPRSGETFFDEDNFKRVYEENVEKPCKYFVEQLGPDIFEPALFELDYLPRDENDLIFFRNLARYSVCQSIINDPGAMEEAINRIVGPEDDLGGWY